MADIRDAEEAVLMGSAQVEAWRGAFLEKWYLPYKSMMVNMMLQSLSPEQLKVLEQRSGEALGKVKAGFNVRTK